MFSLFIFIHRINMLRTCKFIIWIDDFFSCWRTEKIYTMPESLFQKHRIECHFFNKFETSHICDEIIVLVHLLHCKLWQHWDKKYWVVFLVSSYITLNYQPIKTHYFLIDREVGWIPHSSSLTFVKCPYPNPNPTLSQP